MAAIRTVMVTMSPLFRDLVRALFAECADLDVVGELDGREHLEEQLTQLAPTLIFIGLEVNERDVIGSSFVRLLPNAKVITFLSNGRDVCVYRMQPQRIALPDASPRMLLDTILEIL